MATAFLRGPNWPSCQPAAGDKLALLVEQLQADPHRFLATVPIGVTLVGTMATAVGGATAVEVLKPMLQQAPLVIVRNAAEPFALLLVVSLLPTCH